MSAYFYINVNLKLYFLFFTMINDIGRKNSLKLAA